jgi:TrmH family RNA methyltransferase
VDGAGIHADLERAVAGSHLVVGLSGKHHRDKHNVTPFEDTMHAIVRRASAGEHVSIVFGTEATGLTKATLDRCHLVTTIPTNPAYPSLNLAQAALLVLYTLFALSGGTQQEIRPPRRRAPPASAALLEDLFADFERALEAIQFFKNRSRLGIMRSLRGPLQRAGLDRREASLLRAAVIEIRRYLKWHGLIDEVGPVGADRDQQGAERRGPRPS